MKYFILLTLFIPIGTVAQNHFSVIEIEGGITTQNKSLPIDIPVIIKWKQDELVKIEYASLVEVKKGKSREYYNSLYATGSAFINQMDEFENDTLIDNPIPYKVIPEKDGKCSILFFLPPLKPNRFYDVKIIRRLKNDEIEDYYELFGYKYENDDIAFRNKLKEINRKQKTFEHYDLGNKLDVAGLSDYYNDKEFQKYYGIIDTTTSAEVMKATKAKIFNEIKLRSIQRIDDPSYSLNMLAGETMGATTVSFVFDTRAKSRITPDFGYIYYGFQDDFSGVLPYLGFHVEFRSFDKNIPLKLIEDRKLLHRLSFHTGITLGSIKKDSKRDDLFSGKSMLAGLGFRVTNSVRFSGGVLIFNKEDSNPLVNNKSIRTAPYLSFSIDLSLKSMLNDVSALIPINRN